jgi:hypothetical protein
MIEEIATEGSDKRWWDYRDLFNSKNAWWRNICVIGMALFSQWAGNGAVSYFLPVLLESLGVRSPKTQLVGFHSPFPLGSNFLLCIAITVLPGRNPLLSLFYGNLYHFSL